LASALGACCTFTASTLRSARVLAMKIDDENAIGRIHIWIIQCVHIIYI
jgi:hypothetical protein